MGKLHKSLNGNLLRSAPLPGAAMESTNEPQRESDATPTAIPFQVEAEFGGWEPLFEEAIIPFIEVPDAGSSSTPIHELLKKEVKTDASPRLLHLEQMAEEAKSIGSPLFHDFTAKRLDPSLEEFESIGQAVLKIMHDRELSSIMLIALEQEVGQVELSVKLGRIFAEKTQQPVLLIDASIDAKAITQWLPIAPAPGWQELLQGMEAGQVIQRSGHMGLDVIASGNRLAGASPAAWAKQSGILLRQLQRFYRLLLMNSPTWPQSSNGLLLAEEVAASCVLHTAKQRDHPWLSLLIDSLRVHHPVLGTILVDE